jgi:hypothetical protein
MKQNADKKRRECSYAVGDKVLLTTKHMSLKGARKLLPRFVGPFEVIQVVNPVAVRLALPESSRMHDVFHVSMLRPYRQGDGAYVPPPPTIVDGAFDYEVEAILGHKVCTTLTRLASSASVCSTFAGRISTTV